MDKKDKHTANDHTWRGAAKVMYLFISQISQLVSSLNQPPRPGGPGRSPLGQQLQALGSKGRAAAGIGPPMPSQAEHTYYGHDPMETGKSAEPPLNSM